MTSAVLRLVKESLSTLCIRPRSACGAATRYGATSSPSAVFAILCIAALVFAYKIEKNFDTMFIVSFGFTSLLTLFIVNLFVLSCLRRRDWVGISEEGLEICMHSSLFLILPRERTFVSWDSIVSYTKLHKFYKGNSVTLLFLHLKGESKCRIYFVDCLQGQGEPIFTVIHSMTGLKQDDSLHRYKPFWLQFFFR